MLNVVFYLLLCWALCFIYCYAECRVLFIVMLCHYAEHCVLYIVTLSVIMLNIVFYLLLCWVSLCWMSWRHYLTDLIMTVPFSPYVFQQTHSHLFFAVSAVNTEFVRQVKMSNFANFFILANVFLWVGTPCGCTGTFPRNEGWKELLSGLAPSSQTVGFLTANPIATFAR